MSLIEKSSSLVAISSGGRGVGNHSLPSQTLGCLQLQTAAVDRWEQASRFDQRKWQIPEPRGKEP